MLLYTLKRLLLLLPSLLLISVVAFGLKQCSSKGDVEWALAEAELGADAKTRTLTYEREYRRLLEQQNAHLPPFYVALRSQAIPDTLHRIIPLAHRQALRTLTSRYGHWPSVQAYQHALRQVQIQLWTPPSTGRTDAWIKVEQLFQPLPKWSTLAEIQARLSQLSQAAKQVAPPPTPLLVRIANCERATTAIKTEASPWRRYIPALHYYGKENQYHRWLAPLLRLDFGLSLRTREPVTERVLTALGWTLRINIIAILIAFGLAIPLGVFSAVYAGSRWERWVNLFLFLLYALPSFWVATLVGKFLTTPEFLDWFPPYGVGTVTPGASWWTALKIRAHHLFLPICCVTYVSLAVIVRQVRRSMRTILQSDFIRTARAKGLSQRRVVWQHAFRNGLFPLITIFGNVLPAAVTGAVIIEFIFSIPGLGWLTLQSISDRDWPVVYTLLLLLAVATILGIVLADLLYAWADPRVRLGNDTKRL